MHGLAVHAGRQSRDGRKGLRGGDLGVLGALPGAMRDGGLHWGSGRGSIGRGGGGGGGGGGEGEDYLISRTMFEKRRENKPRPEQQKQTSESRVEQNRMRTERTSLQSEGERHGGRAQTREEVVMGRRTGAGADEN